jgi:membrane protein required for colicin V production
MNFAVMISVLKFSIIDWLVLFILIGSIVVSAMKGFVREAFRLGSIVLAFLLASWFYRPVSVLFKDVVKTESLALFFGFSVVFLGTLLVGFLVTWLITKFVKLARIQFFDRCLGAAFGFIRGWLLGAIIFMGLTAFNVQTERVKSSELAPYFLPGSRVIAYLTPYDLRARFLVGLRTIEKWWQQPS